MTFNNSDASDDYVITTNGNGTGTVARVAGTPVASANDIKITPGQAVNTIEYMLFYE